MALDDGVEEVVFAVEVVIDQPLGDAGALGDVFDGGALDALLGEERQRGVDQLVAPLLRLELAFGGCGHVELAD